MEDGDKEFFAGNYKEAVKLYQKASDQGSAKAQLYLALMYEKGKGVKQDYKKAVVLFTKATDQGDATAQNNLAIMYEFGLGVKQDKTKAYQLYMKADKQGQFDAKIHLDKLCKNSPSACK